MAIIRRSRTFRSPTRNKQWSGVTPASAIAVPANGSGSSILVDGSFPVAARMNRMTVMRIVGEVAIWYPVTTPPASTITTQYLFGIKTADSNSTSNLPLPTLQGGDDWMYWRGGTLHYNSTGDAYFAARHSIDIKTRRKMSSLNDILYVVYVNLGAAPITAWHALRVLLQEAL